ncbi:hypothetical protein BCL90_1379 [Pedobacter alluvionis]|uniref:Uncharacterized protein n=1 Tax=Pedobacter alluvionis TaxID=475253 RepID=A0A497YAK0_9SPHI|nr:hypothetical protein BCL90_1379 [Pedobacter alluvionis]
MIEIKITNNFSLIKIYSRLILNKILTILVFLLLIYIMIRQEHGFRLKKRLTFMGETNALVRADTNHGNRLILDKYYNFSF